ncbi:MAG: Gfo/Idh/MocA family oxidoreductase [Bacteroidota bacterium]
MKKIINTAITSFGMSGQVFHAPFLLTNPHFTITKILERTKNISKEKVPEAKIVRSYKEILDDNEIDLVVVNTPNFLHFKMAKQALLHGKHVVLEKPFTNTVEEGKVLIELAKQKGLLLSVYHNRRFDNGHKTVKQILDRKLLGDLKIFEAHFDRFRPEPGPKKWKEEENPGAGILYDLGSHLIDEALTLFGMPNAIYADLQIQRKNGQVTDYFDIKLNYESLTVKLVAGMLMKEAGPKFVLHGDTGSYIKYGNDPQEKQLMNGVFPDSKKYGIEDESNWGILNNDNGRGAYPTLPGTYQDFYDNIYQTIVNKKELLIEPEEALDVIFLIEKAIQSDKERRTVLLDKN